MKTSPDPQYRHRFPVEIISHAVWLYHVFSLSLRDVELILAQRGVFVSYETVRRWCEKFGESFAHNLRRRRPRPGDKWHLDEVFIRIRGELHYLWRAVDQNGVVLDVLVQKRRDGKAAKRFFKRLLKGLQYVPRVIVTDKLKSYAVAKRAPCCRLSSTGRAAISTTASRIHTDRPDGENGRCKDSNHLGRRNGSSPPMPSSMATSIRDRHRNEGQRISRGSAQRLSKSGRRRLARKRQRNLESFGKLFPTIRAPQFS